MNLEQTNTEIETVAPAQPFLNEENEQMKKLEEQAKRTGEETRIGIQVAESIIPPSDTSHLPLEIQAQLKELEEIKAKERKEQFEEEENALLDKAPEKADANLSPEIQAQLKELEEIKAKEKQEQDNLEGDPNYVKFSKPYNFEGKEYKGIKLDFDEMTGADILEAEEEFIATKTQTAAQTPLKELSKGYLSFFAARACAQPVDFILGLDGKSFAKITRKAQSFLLAEG